MSTYQVRELEEADQIIREHERKTKTAYSLLRSTRNFGCVYVPSCANDENEVRFETVGVPYCGVPFFVAGLKILQCQSYRGRGARKKKEIKSEDGNGINGDQGEEEQKPLIKKKKKSGRPHRLGCTATIIMKEVIYYPEFQLYEHSRNNKIAIARQLKDALKAKLQVQKDRIIYVSVPSISDHYGHSVGTSLQKQSTTKRVYVKNDFYGHNEPGSSKKVYYPINQEKVNMNLLTKRLKVDEDDTETKAKEVREVLQSIMGLTYKAGTTEAYQELKKDLLQARLKYLQTIQALFISSPTSNSTGKTSVPFSGSSQEISFAPAHQVLTVQAPTAKVVENSVVSTGAGWSSTSTERLHSNAQVIPGPTRVLAVATLPITVSSAPATVAVSGPLTVANAVTVQQSAANNSSNNENTNQETSIFIEAMEAIFNSQI